MVLHVDGGPHDTVRCYFTTFSHEFLEFLYEGRRYKDQYVTKCERTSKWENAVRKSHTDSGLMHPSAMSTNNDEKDEGDGKDEGDEEDDGDFACSSAISGSGIIFSSSTTSSNTSSTDAGISSSLLSASSSDADFEIESSFVSFFSSSLSWISGDSFSCSSSLDDKDALGFSGWTSLIMKLIQIMIL